MYCLWCDEEILQELDWKSFFQGAEPQKLCKRCVNALEILQGNKCVKCSRLHDEKLCLDCQRWGENDPLMFNYSVFNYNHHIQEIVAQWKYRGDYQLGKAFQNTFLKTFLRIFAQKQTFVLLPIPLSEARMKERRFNQAKMLADFLPFQQIEALSRTIGEKQAKKSRGERLSMENPFLLNEKVNQPVVLIDDIYTTGATIRHASRVLHQGGCPKVYAYTLIRG